MSKIYFFCFHFKKFFVDFRYFLFLFEDNHCLFQGFFGEECNSICSCQNGGSCDAVTGVCICPPGVKGDNCEDGCPPGFYKPDCDQHCPTQCASGFCNRMFGFCECDLGKFGPSCDLPCPPFTYGSNCLDQCTCNHDNTDTCDSKVCSKYFFKLRKILENLICIISFHC
jgi:hypothetical protein